MHRAVGLVADSHAIGLFKLERPLHPLLRRHRFGVSDNCTHINRTTPQSLRHVFGFDVIVAYFQAVKRIARAGVLLDYIVLDADLFGSLDYSVEVDISLTDLGSRQKHLLFTERMI